MNQKRYLRALFALILLFGCAGTKPPADEASLHSWVGVWRGVAIVEGTKTEPDEWILHLTSDNLRLSGRISSGRGLFSRIKVEKLAVNADELSFSFSYETSRGLRAVFHHSAIREGHKLLSLFQGSEGGRAFRGKWEARYEP